MVDEKFFIEKIRSIFDLDQRTELAKKNFKRRVWGLCTLCGGRKKFNV